MDNRLNQCTQVTVSFSHFSSKTSREGLCFVKSEIKKCEKDARRECMRERKRKIERRAVISLR